ncbi:hypothetical protein ADUPG1_005842, partial [Aduncisulcus paluster]
IKEESRHCLDNISTHFKGTVPVVTESPYRVGTCIRKVDGKSSKGERFYLVRHGKTSERIKTEMCPVQESFQGKSSTYQPSFEGFRCFRTYISRYSWSLARRRQRI